MEDIIFNPLDEKIQVSNWYDNVEPVIHANRDAKIKTFHWRKSYVVSPYTQHIVIGSIYL